MHINKRLSLISSFFVTNILPAFVWIFLLYGFDEVYAAHLTLLAAAIHEIGHCLALTFKNKRISLFKGHVSGFRICTNELNTYSDTIFILLAGPFVNLLVAAILYFLPALEYLEVFRMINLVTGLSNLLPAEGFDGYEALKLFLEERECANGIYALEKISFVFIIVCVFISLYFIGKADSGYWMFALFFILLITKIKKMLSFSIFGE